MVVLGDTVVRIGHAACRNLKALRVVAGPKMDVWTIRDGFAVHHLELFDIFAARVASA